MTAYASASDSDLTKILKILRPLEPIELEALHRYYMQAQDAARVAAELGIPITRFRELKSRVKRAYLDLKRSN